MLKPCLLHDMLAQLTYHACTACMICLHNFSAQDQHQRWLTDDKLVLLKQIRIDQLLTLKHMPTDWQGCMITPRLNCFIELFAIKALNALQDTVPLQLQ